MNENNPMTTADLLGTRGKWSNDHDAGEVNEPDVSMVNGRPSMEWEREGIRRRKLAAREAAAELVRVARPAAAR